MPSEQISQELLQAALVGLERKRVELAEQISTVRRMLGGRASTGQSVSAAPERRRRRRMSAAGRKRIAEAQRKRWAAVKGTGTSAPAKKTAAPKKRRISAAARKAMSEATKKRWADYRAKKAGEKKGAAKKTAKTAGK